MGSFDVEIQREWSPRALAELATRQHGVVARWQLLARGVGPGAVDHALRTGRLQLIYRGVYAVGHRKLSLQGRWLAAVLACGRGAVLSHRGAGQHWGISRTTRRDIDVITASRGRHGHRGLTLHRVRSLHPADITVRDGIPVTTVARTLLDNAEVVRSRQLRRMFEEAQRLDLFDLRALHATMARGYGRRGLKPLGALIAEHVDAPATKGELEARFHDILRANPDIPMPQFNVALYGYVVDAFWPVEGLVVELDGFEFHGKSKAQHERDRRKQLDLQLARYEVARFTWSMLSDPDAAARKLRAFLALARSRR